MTAASNGLTDEQRALALYTGGHLEAALDAFRSLVQQQPRFAKHHFNVALVLHKMERDVEAVEHARAGLALNPDDAKARRFLDMLEARLPPVEPGTPAVEATPPTSDVVPPPDTPRLATPVVKHPGDEQRGSPALKRVVPPPPAVPNVPGLPRSSTTQPGSGQGKHGPLAIDGSASGAPPSNPREPPLERPPGDAGDDNHVVAGKPVTNLKALLARGTGDDGLVSFNNTHELDAYKASILVLVGKYLDKKIAAKGLPAPPNRDGQDEHEVEHDTVPRAVNMLAPGRAATITAPQKGVPHLTSWPGGIAPAALVDGDPVIPGDLVRQMQVLARYRGEVQAHRVLQQAREAMVNDARAEPLASNLAKAATTTGTLVPRAKSTVDDPETKETTTISTDDEPGDTLNDTTARDLMLDLQSPGATLAAPREAGPRPASQDKKVQDIIDLLAVLSSKDGKDNEHVTRRHLEQVKQVARDFYDDARYDATIAILKAYIALFPEDLEATFNLGFAYREDGNYVAAGDVFKGIIEFYYDNAYAWHNLSLIYALGNEGPLELYSLQMARDFGYPVDYQRLSRLALAYEARNPFD